MAEEGTALPDAAARDLALLRRFEPVLAYTKGERFFPADAAAYVRCCSLWRGDEPIVPAGELTLDRLAAVAAEHPGAPQSLLLVQRPFARRKVRRFRAARAKPPIARSGRLAAVGLMGRVRALWADPLGWAGLQKIPPDPEEQRRDLRDRIAALDEEIKDADAGIERDRAALRRLRATAVSLDGHGGARRLARRRWAEVAAAEAALAVRVRERTELVEERAAHEAALARPAVPEDPQAHLREPHRPYLPGRGPRTRFLHVWAALSTPLFILAVVAIFVVPHEPVAVLFGALVLLFVTMEAWARRRLLAFATGLLVLAAAMGAAALLGLAIVYGGRYVLLAPLVVVAGVLLVVNLRELFHR